jgi:hypothetical protein
VRERLKSAWKLISENALISSVLATVIVAGSGTLWSYCTTPSGTSAPPAPSAPPPVVRNPPEEPTSTPPYEASVTAERSMEGLRVKNGVRQATRAETKGGLDALPVGTCAFVLAEDVGMRIRRPDRPTKTSDSKTDWRKQYFEVHVVERGKIYLAGYVTPQDKRIVDSVYMSEKKKPIALYDVPDGEALVAADVPISGVWTENFRRLRRVGENEYFVGVFDLRLKTD